MLKKETKEKFNKKYYLLGRRKEDGQKVWLEEGSWDCDWYWGFGYIEIFNHNYTDIEEHTHFDSLFLHKISESWEEYFQDTVIDKDEMWRLLELMRTFYICKQYAEMLYRGSGISTQEDVKELISNDSEYNRINKEVIPQIMSKVYELLRD